MAGGCPDRQARTDQRDSPDRTETALANEPTESTEASEPADPIDRIEPADPIERIDPADPIDKMDPLEPMLRIDPADPVGRRERSLLRIGPFSQLGPAAAQVAPDQVISETARILKPGGLYLFDTINRTLKSKLLAIKLVQQWPLTRLTDVAFHDWDMFIKPAELAAILERHGLAPGETTGLGARATPLAVLRSLASARLGRITYGELSRRLNVGQVSSTAISYMGYAAKTQR